jgi:putative heme-binding domain-containing protein
MTQTRFLLSSVFGLLAAFSTIGRANAADGPRPAWTTSNLKGTPTPPAPYEIRPAFPNLKFTLPTSLSEIPGGRMLITEIGGDIYTFPKKAKTSSRERLLQIPDAKIWHATVHPKFEKNGHLFVCYSKAGTSHVSRFKVEGTAADSTREEVLLTWPAGGHNGGCLQFGTDGMLYISTGDGSGPNPPDSRTAAQDVSNLFGCVLRIDVDRKPGDGSPLDYVIPSDNPFVDMENARPEIWAYGLRNPWKFGVDPKTGNIFAADNGWETWEMVHRIVRGGNCGWPIMEGRAVLRSEVKRGPTPIRPPVKDHHHSEANSVIGGPIYRGSKLPELDGTFIYGDYITGTIWGVKSDGEDSYTHTTLVDTDQRITAFAEGSAGELFVLDYDYTGQIYEIVPSTVPDSSAKFPRKLSDTGLFISTELMRPAPGVIPYEVTVERWMDGYKTQRWVAIPGSGSITLKADSKPADYPDGTVFVKHVSHSRGVGRKDVPAETQILHYDNGRWNPYSYVWRVPPVRFSEPLDGILNESAATSIKVVTGINEYGRTMGPMRHINAENECRMCHNAGAGFVLGFESNQLNRAAILPPGTFEPDQLDFLFEKKVIAARPEFPEHNPARLVDPHDREQSLDDRARSYLHGNCSSCHHPGGNAIVSFFLRRDLPFEKLKTNKGTGIGTFGIKNAKIIVPGDPYRSILLYRMSKLGYGRMPYIGSKRVDSSGVSLMTSWIRTMPHDETDKDSAAIRKGTGEQKALAKLVAGTMPKGLPTLADPASVETLLKSTEGALALTGAVHGEQVRRVDMRHAYRSTGSDIRGLIETFIPEGARRKTLGRNVDPEKLLAVKGESARGKLIFYSDGARCRNCHDLNDAAKSTGPTLTEIRKKYRKPEEMLQHILKPSLKVDEKFAMWVVITDKGQVHSGLILSQTDDEVVLKTAERKTVRVAKTEIDEMKKSPQSLMPEGILSDLTAQEAADLLAWFGADKFEE